MVFSLHFDTIAYNLWPLNNRHQPNQADQAATVTRRIGHHVYLANLVDDAHSIVQTVALKIAYNNEVPNLEKEAGFYRNELLRLQGTVVPRCWGYFKGQVNEMGGFIGCLVLEYCQGTIEKDMAEFGRLIMVACCQLHQVGIVHGDLLDGHHIVKMGHGIRIVDFSRAYTHECLNAVPSLTSCKSQPHLSSCMELSSLEQTFGALDYPVNKPLSIRSMTRIFKKK